MINHTPPQTHMRWKERLKALLQEALKSDNPVVLVGIGNTLRGDDGIGVKIAEALKDSLECSKIRVIVVEDRVDMLGRFLGDLKPSLMIFFDAADFGGKPGEIRILDLAEASGKTISTHLIPLDVILKVIGVASPSYVIGVQMMNIEFGGRISEPVKVAGKMIVEFLEKELASICR